MALDKLHSETAVCPEVQGLTPIPTIPMPMSEKLEVLGIVLTPAAGAIACMFYFRTQIGRPEIVVFLTMYFVSAIGISVGFHRLFTHASFRARPIVRYALAISGSMAGQGPLIEWVAIHRIHHRFADRAGDPHSPYFPRMSVFPRLRGFLHSHVVWLFDDNPTDLSSYAEDIVSDRRLTAISQLYYLWLFLGLLIPGLVCWLLEGKIKGLGVGIVCGGFARLFALHHVTWSINSVCHIWGSRPYLTLDQSANNPLLAIFGVGEGWHNNHHAFPYSASHGLYWWQVDVSYLFIAFIEKLGLASGVKVPTKEQIARKWTAGAGQKQQGV